MGGAFAIVAFLVQLIPLYTKNSNVSDVSVYAMVLLIFSFYLPLVTWVAHEDFADIVGHSICIIILFVTIAKIYTIDMTKKSLPDF